MRVLFASTILAAVALPAWAQTAPVTNPGDPHVRFIEYDEERTNPITVQVGRETDITVNPMERIVRVVLPQKDFVDSLDPKDANQTPLINNLPLFGKAAGDTTLVVLTNTLDGHEKPYVFNVHVIAAPKDGSIAPDATILLKFRYHEQEKQAAVQQAQMTWKDKQAAKQREIALARLNVDPFYGEQHYQYMAQGRFPDVVPTQVTDNGQITAFRYPGNMEHPAVFLVRDGISRPEVCDGKKPTTNDAPEETLNTTINDDMIVVQKTAPHFRLRAGDQVAEIYNCAWNAIGVNPGSGTTSPDIIRKVVTSK